MKITNKTLPPSPKTCEEIINVYKNENVMNSFGITLQDENDADALPSTMFFKYAHESRSFSYVIFASDNIINSIQKKIPVSRRKFLMDATFKVCPFGMYNQLLVVYIEHLEETTPFMFILMSRKTQRTYEHAFQYIKKNIIDLEGKSFTTDFEVAMRNALRIVFPATKLFSCWFHFTQAAKKRAMQTPKLYPFLYQNKEAREIYYQLLSLPLLPPEDILTEFNRLKVIALANHRPVFAEFIKYFESQWIIKVRMLFISHIFIASVFRSLAFFHNSIHC